MSDELADLRNRWLATHSFDDEQAYLKARVWADEVQFVGLDPDGTMPNWLVLVVRGETGVVYGTQCAGVATIERLVEGYLVPLGGSKYNGDDGKIEFDSFTKVFHVDDDCRWGWAAQDLPAERLAALGKLVEQIPYWCCGLDGSDTKSFLQVDIGRVGELTEAWIPVETPDGPGVLLCKNCD